MTPLEQRFRNSLNDIIKNITLNVIYLFNKYGTDYDTGGMDYPDIEEVYQMNFKQYFLEHFTTETEHVLNTHAQNLAHAIFSFREMNKTDTPKFIELMIIRQLQFIDIYELYLI